MITHSTQRFFFILLMVALTMGLLPVISAAEMTLDVFDFPTTSAARAEWIPISGTEFCTRSVRIVVF